jgi:hypothetical protein
MLLATGLYMAQLILGPAIALGLIIGLYEALLIHRDVHIPTHRLGHSIHALLLSTLFVLIAMNTQMFLSLFPQIAAIPYVGSVHAIRGIVGLIALIKIHTVSRAISSSVGAVRGLGETWFHSVLIAALIVAAPYAYENLNLASFIPAWLDW